ncbi:hypothetical protein [Pseudomonas sp. Pdm06]|uniref:hypothetical protein n=1 Tax=Pseudomonas sp. Pdm06 TaxID=1790044 RepID=UPI0017813073|nr:hypothetical protein [Pseudomonas sp. Pdm06]MBD9462792.1 hypothetical protein [Pseudomonas sp. Pdm06]
MAGVADEESARPYFHCFAGFRFGCAGAFTLEDGPGQCRVIDKMMLDQLAVSDVKIGFFPGQEFGAARRWRKLTSLNALILHEPCSMPSPEGH